MIRRIPKEPNGFPIFSDELTAPTNGMGRWSDSSVLDHSCLQPEITDLHDERLSAVQGLLVASGARSILDLGCGPGPLLVRLARIRQFRRIAAMDISADAILALEALRGKALPENDRISLFEASFTEADYRFKDFDAAVLLETIEHIEPSQLSRVENAVFGCFRPKAVLMTTPNREYNEIYGIPDGAFRHADHRFEWTRAKFKAWSSGVARRNGYQATFAEIGNAHPVLGGPTQMAIFSRCVEVSDGLDKELRRP